MKMLHNALPQRARAHRQAHGHPQEVRVVELDAGALVAVVVQRLQTGLRQLIRQGVRRLSYLRPVQVQRHEMHGEWSN